MTTPISATAPLRKRFLLGLMLGLVIGMLGSWSFGLFSTRYHPIEETKLCYVALKDQSANLSPQTREYLKARYYWNAAVWISPSWMAGLRADFGPVDDSVLAGLDPYKDASSSAEVYEQAQRIHQLSSVSK